MCSRNRVLVLARTLCRSVLGISDAAKQYIAHGQKKNELPYCMPLMLNMKLT